MIEILDVKDAEPKKLDITPELAIAGFFLNSRSA